MCHACCWSSSLLEGSVFRSPNDRNLLTDTVDASPVWLRLIAWKHTHGTVKCMFLYSAVSDLLDHPMCFTLQPPADLFIRTRTLLLCETFRHAAITAFTNKHISYANCSQFCVHTPEWREWKCQALKGYIQSPGLSWLRLCHLPRWAKYCLCLQYIR